MIDLGVTAARICGARREKGYTQEELSARLGVSAKAVSKWERALSVPDVDLLPDLAKILGVTVDYLLDKDSADASRPEKAAKPSDEKYYEVFYKDIAQKQEQICVLIGTGFFTGHEKSLDVKRIIEQVKMLRRRDFNETGVMLPVVWIRDERGIGETDVEIVLFGEGMWSLNRDGGAPDCAEIPEVVLVALESLIRKYLHSFVNRHTVKLAIENLKERLPFVVEGVVPERVSLTRLKLILKGLVKAGTSIANLLPIIETIDECVEAGRTDDETVAAIRGRLWLM